MSAQTLFEQLRHELGLLDFPADNVTLTGRDPVYPTPFRIGEAAAAILALQGVMLNALCRQQGGSCTTNSGGLSQCGCIHACRGVSAPERSQLAVQRPGLSDDRFLPYR